MLAIAAAISIAAITQPPAMNAVPSPMPMITNSRNHTATPIRTLSGAITLPMVHLHIVGIFRSPLTRYPRPDPCTYLRVIARTELNVSRQTPTGNHSKLPALREGFSSRLILSFPVPLR